jgi:hypothetical protein
LEAGSDYPIESGDNCKNFEGEDYEKENLDITADRMAGCGNDCRA